MVAPTLVPDESMCSHDDLEAKGVYLDAEYV